MIKTFCRVLLAAAGISCALPASGQWLSQTNVLVPGWNSVFLHVDASHSTLTNLIAADPANPILEVWMWAPAPSTLQFVDAPQSPIDTGSQWVSWVRTNSAGSRLQRLVANGAFLVNVGTNVSTYNWVVKGRPAAPSYQWTSTGLNFLGFPTLPANPPTFESFLAPIPALQLNAKIYQYTGGQLGTTNPSRVLALRTTRVKRGQAYWIRAGDLYNTYFSPFELSLAGTEGVNFRDSLSMVSFRLRNLTASSVTVKLQLLPSEAPPTGEAAISSLANLLVRGDLNTTNLTYGYQTLTPGGMNSWSLAPQGQTGSEVNVVLGLNRYAMTQAAGTVLAGILRLTDSTGFCQVDVPVSAVVASRSGLWIGEASLNQVGEYLKTYQMSAVNPTQPAVSSNGAYIVSSISTNIASVAKPFPVRLILHNPDSGNAQLLQRVFYGVNSQTNYVVARSESSLSGAFLQQARRISSSHLPWTAANAGWSFNGRLESGSLSATVQLDYNDQASNPFLHTYHPDHDGRDTSFKAALPQGSESYAVRRDITLAPRAPADNFVSLTSGGNILTGDYAETVSLIGLARAGGTNDTRQFQARGTFILRRMAAVPVLSP